MKILELRFKNLNSLYGEWVIDFTDPEYVSNGIFALTGPTGAGKSTILDAICLALYGATPRLGKITKSGNEIMSRQTGECYAEVLFESQAGRFRCHWEQRRARRKAEGNLQDQEHQIADANTGKLIETKKSLVGDVIEEKTGMDFDRFTRSILLAQGGFDTFLKADIEQKSRILEQITGTEIYSEISRRVHQRQCDEWEKLTHLHAETDGIVIMESKQEKETQQDFETKQTQEIKLSDALTKTGEAIAWLTVIEGLKEEIHNLTDEAITLQSELEAFKPERAKLEQAIKVTLLSEIYAPLTTLRTQQSADQAALKKEETALPELETSATTQAEFLKTAERLTLKTKKDLTAAAPLIRQIRSLDREIAEQATAISESSEICNREEKSIAAHRQTQIKEQEKRAKIEKSLETVAQYLKNHTQDEWLISGLTGVEEQFGNLLARQEEITLKGSELKNADEAWVSASKDLATATKQCAIRNQEVEKATKNLQQAKDTLNKLLGNKLLREYRTEEKTLFRERAYIRKIEALEKHRSKLEDNKPCPLCGSTEHPFAKGNIPAPDEIEQKLESLTRLISKAEEQEAVIEKLEKAAADAKKDLNVSQNLETHAANDKKAAEKTLEQLKGDLDKLQTGFETLKQTVTRKLDPLGYTVDFSATESTVNTLKSKISMWQEQVKQKSDFEKQIAAINSEITRLDAVIETQGKALAEKQENLARLKSRHTTGMEERKKGYGDKNPDEEEARLNTVAADADKAEKEARCLNTELQTQLIKAKTHIESLKKRIDERAPGLKKMEMDFSAALKSERFANEKHFLEARLTNEERVSLSSRARKLDDAQTELKAKQKYQERRLATETAKKVTEKTLQELMPQFKKHEESLKTLRYAIATLQHELSENTKAKERIKEKQSAIEAQKKECHRWEKLYVLIGSADGKKYRTFAQGLTFELMVMHANRQLEKMTDRYLLIRDEQQPLALNVVDNYQAGEIRSTRNLSGGESFIVSLTLALGLSKMASRKVRVDSLFLDEGFGTLDEEALETALETLSELQQDGKLIGIISHVLALKERISTQIDITPVSGGRSSVSGPGCAKVVKNE